MQANLVFGWSWILAGFVAGAAIGMRFEREDWLGGYGAFRRRLVRLGHVAFFGTGFVNVLFAWSAPGLTLSPTARSIASAAFIVGGISMPACCALMAWKPGLRPAAVFTLPVASLIAGAAIATAGVWSS